MTAKIKVLAISRDPVLVDFLKRELAGEEFSIVSTQTSGIQLKDVIDAEQPDLIILDIMMPKLDGIGICLELRQWTPNPVMMLSCWQTARGMVRGLNLSSESYLTEPFGGEILKKRIRQMLMRNEMADLIPNSPTNKK